MTIDVRFFFLFFTNSYPPIDGLSRDIEAFLSKRSGGARLHDIIQAFPQATANDVKESLAQVR